MTTTFPLGRHPDAAASHDPRSRAFAATADLPVVTKSWRRYGTVLDQGNIGSCTGNAGRGAQNHAPLHVIGATTYKEPAALELYGSATTIDPYPGFYPDEDTGSDGLSVAKVLKAWGQISAYLHAFGLDHTLATAMNGALMIGTDWREDMFNPDSSGLVRPTGPVVGGHEYVLSGVNTTHRLVRFQNSWGYSWGDYGKFYMTFADFGALLDEGGDAILLTR